MALISFDENINQQIEERNDLLNQLKNNKNRFNAPPSSDFFQFDELSKMLPFQWDGIDAPLLSFATDYSRDIVVHKFVNLGGAKLEDTGRNPLVMSCDIPFINTIVPAGNEGWVQGSLYPIVYDKFLQSLLDAQKGKETRILNHPELGQIPCKVTSFKTNLSGGYRGGVIISAQFIEDNLDTDNKNNLADNLNKTNTDIITLNQYLDDLSPDPTALQMKNVALGLFGLLNAIKGLIDSTALIGMQVLGLIEQMNYRCNAIVKSAEIADNMLYAKAVNMAYVIRADAIYLGERIKKETPVSINRNVNIYHTDAITTLAGLSVIVHNSIRELIDLNPFLLATPYIRSGTKVKYYSGGLNVKEKLPKV